MTTEGEPPMRRRILDATGAVLARSGSHNLQLADVAAEAGVSRPTLYRHFGSKERLLDEFCHYEQDKFDAGIAAAMTGLRGDDRLDAALQFIVEFQYTHSSAPIVHIEPAVVLAQTGRVMPIMRDRIRRAIAGDNADIKASALVRIAVCHYLIQDDAPDVFLAELRLAAGLDPHRRRQPRSVAG